MPGVMALLAIQGASKLPADVQATIATLLDPPAQPTSRDALISRFCAVDPQLLSR